MIDWLSEPYVGTIVGLSGIVIGILIAIFFYFKSKIVAKPQYVIENINLIDLKHGIKMEEIEMLFKGEQIFVLNKTTFYFVNNGKKTINSCDIVPDELLIDFSENDPAIVHIFEIGTKTSREAISVSANVNEDKNGISISFNYLDYKDYFTVDILHSGEKIPSKLNGDIKGVPKGITNITARKQDKLIIHYVTKEEHTAALASEKLKT